MEVWQGVYSDPVFSAGARQPGPRRSGLHHPFARSGGAGPAGRGAVLAARLEGSLHLLKDICCFPLLVLKGIYHWKYCFVPGV